MTEESRKVLDDYRDSLLGDGVSETARMLVEERIAFLEQQPIREAPEVGSLSNEARTVLNDLVAAGESGSEDAVLIELEVAARFIAKLEHQVALLDELERLLPGPLAAEFGEVRIYRAGKRVVGTPKFARYSSLRAAADASLASRSATQEHKP